MLAFMLMRQRTRITKGGQISIPAAVRHRWGSSAVTLEDRGDAIVIEPAPEDPVTAAAGSLARFFPEGFDEPAIRASARAEEQHAARSKLGDDAA